MKRLILTLLPFVVLWGAFYDGHVMKLSMEDWRLVPYFLNSVGIIIILILFALDSWMPKP